MTVTAPASPRRQVHRVACELDAHGEIDDHAALCLRLAIDEAHAAVTEMVLVDLRDLTKIDATGLALFTQHTAGCYARGMNLGLLISADEHHDQIAEAFVSGGLGDQLDYLHQAHVPGGAHAGGPDVRAPVIARPIRLLDRSRGVLCDRLARAYDAAWQAGRTARRHRDQPRQHTRHPTRCAPDTHTTDSRAAAAMTALAPSPIMPAAAGMIVALPRSPDVGTVARAAVCGFADQLGQRRTADACLLVSEAVTNAFRHGRGQIRLTIALHDHVALFAVHDEGNIATLQPSADPGEHGGFGLSIVARVADRWGTSSAPTRIWFELHPSDSAPDRRGQP